MASLGNIRDVDSYIAELWSFAMFDGCFGSSKSSPSDIDGIVDSGGHLLVLEGKNVHDGGLDGGQRVMFRNMRYPKSVASLIWWGDAPAGPIDRMRYDAPVPVIVPARGDVGLIQKASLSDLREAVEEWHRWANSAAHQQLRKRSA